MESPKEAFERLTNDAEKLHIFFEDLENWINDEPLSSRSQLLEEDLASLGAAYLKPLMTNPERHTRHAEIIIEYILKLQAQKTLYSMATVYRQNPAFKWLIRNFAKASTSRFRKRWKRLLSEDFDDFLQRMAEAKDALMDSIEPFSFRLTINPPSQQPELTSGSQIWNANEVSVQISAIPERSDIMKLLVSLEVPDHDDVYFDSPTPESTIEEVEAISTSISQEQSISRSDSFSASVDAELGISSIGKVKGANGVVESFSSGLRVSDDKVSSSKRYVPSITASAGGNMVEWTLNRTPQQILHGGHALKCRLLSAPTNQAMVLVAKAEIHVRGWGRLRRETQFSFELG